MTSMTSGIKKYIESQTLLQYQEPIEIPEGQELPIKKKQNLPSIESNPNVKSTLNAMFQPKEIIDGDKHKIAYVSLEPATREKARDLYRALDEKIKERHAREKGICPVRAELYSQCFDELIRQVTIECPERGLLLKEVREEIKMTIDSYRTLYDSAILFSIKKQLQAEEGKDELKKKIVELEKKKKELTNKKIILDDTNSNDI